MLQDPDICDATFIVDDGTEKEEIRAPSQIMAISSPFFKSLFYPISESKEREINGMQPKTFRKILDYLFRGRVSLSSIEYAWKVKVAGRTFQLKELEELCTKFLQYRIDSRNLIHFLKNTIKYDTPDLRDVVISRLLKDAEKAFENEQMLELSEEELMNIMKRRPQVKAAKVMDVLIKWAKKKFALEAPKVEKKLEATEEPKKEVKDDVEMKEEKKDETTEETKKDEEKKEDTKVEEENKDTKVEEEKKDTETVEEKKDTEKVEETKEEKKEDAVKDEKADIMEVEEKPVELDLIVALQHFIILYSYILCNYLLINHVNGTFFGPRFC